MPDGIRDSVFPSIERFTDSLGSISFNPVGGLSKREFFAAVAMHGMLADPSLRIPSALGSPDEIIARYAVSCADSLISAIGKIP